MLGAAVRNYMLSANAVSVNAVIVVVVLSGVIVYLVRSMKPDWLRIWAGKFGIALGRGADTPRDATPFAEGRELEAGSEEPPSSGQDNATALLCSLGLSRRYGAV